MSKNVVPHYYALGGRSAWTGLPLSRLGPHRWASGLYFLHDGLVSVQPDRIGMAPWTEVQQIGIADWVGSGMCLRVQLGEWGMRTFPAGAQDSDVTIPLRAITALKQYVDLDGFVPSLRSDRPSTPTYIPYGAE